MKKFLFLFLSAFSSIFMLAMPAYAENVQCNLISGSAETSCAAKLSLLFPKKPKSMLARAQITYKVTSSGKYSCDYFVEDNATLRFSSSTVTVTPSIMNVTPTGKNSFTFNVPAASDTFTVTYNDFLIALGPTQFESNCHKM